MTVISRPEIHRRIRGRDGIVVGARLEALIGYQPHPQGRGCVAVTRRSIPGRPEQYSAVMYPQLEHIADFEAHTKDLQEEGPASHYPGIVGIVQALLGANGTLHINSIQGAFRIKRRGDEHAGIPNALAKQYGGWMNHCLEAVLTRPECTNNTQAISFERDYRSKGSWEEKKQAFLTAVRKHGFTSIEQTGQRVVATKPGG